jgi:signal transduction histidine kinase/ligand-binding sensor domain-containing protein
MRLRFAILLAVFLGVVPMARFGQATDLSNVLVDYTLTSWSQRDGLPSSTVWAIAQDHDGYLWLGTDAGPVRFDGARFIPLDPHTGIPLPAAPVRAICVTHDGSIWFGFADPGGVTRLHDGELRTFANAQGLPDATVTVLFEDQRNTLWAGTGSGLYRLNGERWTAEGGLPPGPIHVISSDRAGRMLVGTDSGVYRRAAPAATFEPIGRREVVRGVVEDRSGTTWVTDQIVGFRKLDEDPRSIRGREQGRGNRLLLDTSGHVWVGMARQGLWRVRAEGGRPPLVEKTTALVGFSDDGVVSLFQDREGTLWAGTLDGLNRLTPHRLTPITDLGLVGGVETTPDGSVWVGTADAVTQFAQGSVRGRQPPTRLPGLISAMHADASGRLWVATGNAIFRFTNGRPERVQVSATTELARITAIASEPRGALWINDAERGLLRWDGESLAPVPLPRSLQARLVTVYVDPSDVAWLTFANGQVATVASTGTVTVYGRERGLTAGTYRVVYGDSDGVLWLGGTEGLTRFASGHFTTFGPANGLPTESVTAIVEDAAGDLWLGAEGSGIVRIARSEFAAALRDPHHRLRYRLFDKFDGFAGTARWFSNRSAVRTKGDALWFIGGRGITIVTPAALPVGPATALRVRIEGMVADDNRIAAIAPVSLAAQTTRVQIDYAVVSLSSPLRTQFRYRLDGFDADWIDAGTRRQAFYTNLPPRDYRFRVIASSDDGTWSEPAVWTFSIPPMFYQTTWFAALALLAVTAAIGATWRLHLHRVRTKFSVLLRERARLSREIHDTLLQGLYGVALRCEAIARHLDSSDSWLQDQFRQVRGDVQDYIQEARQSIQDLRSPQLDRSGLAKALRESGERATAGTAITFQIAVDGVPQDCDADIEQQLLRIGQEAIVNAVRHAEASAVQMEVHYDHGKLRMRIRDDGHGFDPARVHESDGHYGLSSMKERAESVGGTLHVRSGSGRGAEIEAVVPL